MICTRFAPSPTGVLHIGSVRTALYSYLYAKHRQGKFILRIEDTDRERSTQESVDAILDGMKWLGLEYDEGPYYQTQRFSRYKEVAQQLLEQDQAYRCYCTKERLETLRATQMKEKQKPRYDGHCRHLPSQTTELSDSSSYVLRFKNPLEGSVIVQDFVHGPVEFSNSELDDLIILRSDGIPTYNFTVVVDDWDMKITHVIRGNDHLNNTPRQINILKALKATIPEYVHLPIILGKDGKKMSKREGASNVTEFREAGYLPEAILNYLVRLGWSKGDQEIISIAEMIESFDLKNINKSPAIFDIQKLSWLNQHYLKTLAPEKIALHLEPHMHRCGLDVNQGPALNQLILAQASRCKTLKEMAEKSIYFYKDKIDIDKKEAAKHFNAAILISFQHLLQKAKALNTWEAPHLHNLIEEVASNSGFENMGKLAQPLRIAMTGGTISPPIDMTLELLGKDKVLKRLESALDYITHHSTEASA